MCDPFGSDRMNLHLTYRLLAQELARHGFGVLRVDYPGTCDSSGDARHPSAHPDQSPLSAWLGALDGAASWLRARTAAKELCAFGAVLGGTIAAALAARRTDVTGLLLWAALPTGRAFLREMAAFRAMTKANPAGWKPSDHQPHDLEAMGFLITDALRRDLEGLDVAKMDLHHVQRVALFRRNTNLPLEPLEKALRRTVPTVHVQPAAVVDLASLQDEGACPPPALVEEMSAWCQSAFPHRANVTTPDGTTPPAASAITKTKDGRSVRETVVRFGTDHELFGIRVEPTADLGTTGVVLVNGGANHRVGINRLYTEWARDLAADGLRVFRIDVRGLGDSPPPQGQRHCVLYRNSAQDDVRAAIDHMKASGVTTTYCVGLCAGGYHSLHTAITDPRVAGLVMLNPLRLKRVDSPEVKVESERDFGSVASYGRKLLSPRSIARVLRGKVNVKGIAQSVGARLSARVASRLKKMASSDAPAASWFSGVLLGLTGRGARVCLVLDVADPITERILEDIAPDREKLDASKRFQVEQIANTDHIYTPLWSQEHLGQRIRAILCAWMAGKS